LLTWLPQPTKAGAAATKEPLARLSPPLLACSKM